MFKSAWLDLLEELPSGKTGLGATEMRLLELIARGYSLTNALFHLRGLRRRRVFKEWEIGSLLEGLAHGPTPAVAASTMSYARSVGIITGTATRPTSEAGCR